MQDQPHFWHAHQLPLERGSAKGRGGGKRERKRERGFRVVVYYSCCGQARKCSPSVVETVMPVLAYTIKIRLHKVFLTKIGSPSVR